MDDGKFDPLKSRVSGSPIRDLRSILQRARVLLNSKPVKAIREAQWLIAQWREQAFEMELDSAIDVEKGRLRSRALYEGDVEAVRFFEILIDGRGEVHCDFHRGMESELEGLPAIDDRSRLEYLLEWDMLTFGEPELPDWSCGDFLAAHALVLVEEADELLKRAAAPDDDDLQAISAISELDIATKAFLRKRGQQEVRFPNFLEHLVRDAFELSIEALDAIEKAELEGAASAAYETKRLLVRQVTRANEDANNERQKRKHASNAALLQRHAKRNEAQPMVLNEWDKDRTRFSSAERAGDFFADWLEEQGFKFRQRTVRDWILAHAKKNGVVFR